MAESKPPQAEKLQYQTEVRQLLDILAHSLYAEREVFLRGADLQCIRCLESSAV